MFKRILDLNLLLKKKSHFLFGARATGKTSLIRDQLGSEVILIDLLNSDTYLNLASRPALLAEMIASEHLRSGKKKPVAIDEIQKLPILLNEVHRLIEEKKIQFILTGSSSRKLTKSGTNLLAGRAWKAQLFPLTSHEIPNFDLERYLSFGGLPAVYTSEYPLEELAAYVQTYLTQEIAAESLVRDLPRFSRFLRSAGLENTEQINFSNIASDLGTSATTIREYYRILEDTLIGKLIEPMKKKNSRKEVSTAKFYLFDVGIANALRGIKNLSPNSSDFGRCFEHFIGLELLAALSYQKIGEELKFWRTHTQQEVDFVVADQCSIEVKSASKVSLRDANGLKAYREHYKAKNNIIVSRDPIERVEEGIQFLNYKTFLSDLWEGKLFK